MPAAMANQRADDPRPELVEMLQKTHLALPARSLILVFGWEVIRVRVLRSHGDRDSKAFRLRCHRKTRGSTGGRGDQPAVTRPDYGGVGRVQPSEVPVRNPQTRAARSRAARAYSRAPMRPGRPRRSNRMAAERLVMHTWSRPAGASALAQRVDERLALFDGDVGVVGRHHATRSGIAAIDTEKGGDSTHDTWALSFGGRRPERFCGSMSDLCCSAPFAGSR